MKQLVLWLGAAQLVIGLVLGAWCVQQRASGYYRTWERAGRLLSCGMDVGKLNELVRAESIGPAFDPGRVGTQAWDSSPAAEGLARWLRAERRGWADAGPLGCAVCVVFGAVMLVAGNVGGAKQAANRG